MQRFRQRRIVQFTLGLAGIALLALPPADAASAELEAIEIGKPIRIEVFPADISLRGSRDRTQMVVTGVYEDGTVQDLTRVATFETDEENVCLVDGSVIRPAGDGSCGLVVRVGEQQSSVAVSVHDFEQSPRASFQYGTLAALSKQGCNSGACHGSPSGKGGFRLSLRAFDAELDKLTLIHESFGRRVNPQDPEQSLILLKPMMLVPHGGGKKLRATDPAFEVLRDWIAEGSRVDPPESPQCVGIDVYPPSGRLLKRPAHTQQLSVVARFSDGSSRDITPLAVYTSSDEEVASVNRQGLVVGKDRGQAAVLVRYLSYIESRFITFVRDIEGFAWNDPPQHNYVDELVDDKLQQLQYLPSGLCSDEEFVRRVNLDVIGALPTVEEVGLFLRDESADKRSRLIDQLLDRPEYAKFWALKWGDLLRMTSKQVSNDGVFKYHRWVERALASNMPYDQFADELLTAAGSTLTNPAANFYRTASDTNDCVETISQIFLGARLQCAKCHNHPFERWSQDNYYGMAAFFNRVQRKKTSRTNDLFVWVASHGEVTQPRTGRQMKPWLPLKGDVEQADVDDRRQIFTEWLTRPDNPFFARIEVNRIWSHLFGRGIVDPPDDFRDSNPPSNAALLDKLAQDFVTAGFDRKHILRTMLKSRTYQASFETNAFNQDDTKFFSHYQPRLLSAEQLLDAICEVTAAPEIFGSLPPGTKATHLPAPDLVNNEFLKIFGQPERQTVCECERSSESNLGMAIQFFNGPLIHNKLRDDNNRFRGMVSSGKSDRQVITALHLAAVSRAPTEQELVASLHHLTAKDQQIAARNIEIDQEIDQLQTSIATTRATFRDTLFGKKLSAVPQPIRDDLRAALAVAAGERDAVQTYLTENLAALVQVTEEEVEAALDEAAKTKVTESQMKVEELAKQKLAPGDRRLEALEDICWAILNTNEFLFQH
jgi:hypothetical protein